MNTTYLNKLQNCGKNEGGGITSENKKEYEKIDTSIIECMLNMKNIPNLDSHTLTNKGVNILTHIRYFKLLLQQSQGEKGQ